MEFHGIVWDCVGREAWEHGRRHLHRCVVGWRTWDQGAGGYLEYSRALLATLWHILRSFTHPHPIYISGNGEGKSTWGDSRASLAVSEFQTHQSLKFVFKILKPAKCLHRAQKGSWHLLGQIQPGKPPNMGISWQTPLIPPFPATPSPSSHISGGSEPPTLLSPLPSNEWSLSLFLIKSCSLTPRI